MCRDPLGPGMDGSQADTGEGHQAGPAKCFLCVSVALKLLPELRLGGFLD